MIKKNKNIDNFMSKLQQFSTIDFLKRYVIFRKNFDNDCSFNDGPISINLDITTSCNYECPHCVDVEYLNLKNKFSKEEIIDSISSLRNKGLLSVILIGGGEPTMSPFFIDIVEHIKNCNLQLGIVSNGSRSYKLEEIAPLLTKHDWIRYSLDAANEDTYYDLHLPRKKITLKSIFKSVNAIKDINKEISIGFSFIIFWDNIYINNKVMRGNINEMLDACKLAVKYGFDYISYKPCLVKDDSTEMKESLFFRNNNAIMSKVRHEIDKNISDINDYAKDKISVNISGNLRALLENKVGDFKRQPKVCHAQFFKSVMSPVGIYHCPAFRGNKKAKIGEKDGYCSNNIRMTLQNNVDKLDEFNANFECKDIACFYNEINWWIDGLISGKYDIDSVNTIDDDNFFL